MDQASTPIIAVTATDYTVPAPRATDAVGASLQCAFRPERADSEFDALLRTLDRVTSRH